ncbi:unnamed protein product, partial [Iphiclides podalirius]
MEQRFKWKQIEYNFNGVIYRNDADYPKTAQGARGNLTEAAKFFVQYNNVPIGMEVYRGRVFVTVPRRRHGIPSTLNYVDFPSGSSPALKPYPNPESVKDFVSVYRPRVDACGRLWMVDTGLLEVPGERKQVKPPSIVVYDLNTDQLVLRYELKQTDLVDERTPAGLTSINVEINGDSCSDAYAYITDLATEGLVVYSMKSGDSWRLSDRSFVHDNGAMNFTAAGQVLANWKDGMFSIALTELDSNGKRKAFYHPLVSTQEFSVDTDYLKDKKRFHSLNTYLGERGANSQSGSHDYHARSRTLFFANVAQNAISCWNIDKDLAPENVAVVAQDPKLLAYVSDLKVIDNSLWVLVNQIPKFIYSRLDTTEYNFFIHSFPIRKLLRGTVCRR